MAEPFGYPDIGGALPEAYGAGSSIKDLLLRALMGTAQIPQHVIEAAAKTAPPGVRREDYTDAPAPGGLTQTWQPGDAQRAQATQAAASMMVGSPAVSGVSKAGEVALGIVPVDAGRAFGIPSRLPDSDIFRQAVKNTPGAAVDAEALTMPLKRRQSPDQELAESVRGGVFYQPGGPGGYSYTGKGGYGGSQLVEGETAIKAPLFVKGATGGKAPEAAYDSLIGKGAYQDMRTDALKSMGPLWGAKPGEKEAAVRGFLEKYAPELADSAYEILRNSKQGNQLAYALQEAAVASAARKAGHDAVVGYSVGRGADKAPRISEVFDVRESHYPSPAGDYQTWPADMFGGKVGALK